MLGWHRNISLEKWKLIFGWVPPIEVYNILLNGWFLSRKLKHAERLWLDMKKDGVSPSVVTYGIIVEGYCTMHRVKRAMELVDEMKGTGMQPNAKVYNPIIDALGEAGRLKGIGMEPNAKVYNPIINALGETGRLKEVLPYFSKLRKIEEAMNLYTKMIQSGHTPDRLAYYLLLKMLCEEKRLDLAVQVSKEIRARVYDRDLATSTILIHLLCKMHRFEDAFGRV
ncbi:hypothetical protein REPUB_Repub03eG0114300 [Reevesia pubescens]